jgi:tripartite-type tricarboxylate transporter receptor subunit TctC
MKCLGIARLLLAALAVVFCPQAPAETFPSRPVTIIVPLAPGSGGDQLVRKIADIFTKSLGQPVVIDNRPGGSGIIGAEAAAKAKPDGYTILYGGVQLFCVQQILQPNLPFDAHRDFAPVTLAVAAHPLLLVNARLPVKTLDDFVAYAKARPRALNFGSPGEGSSQRLAGVLLEELSGIEMTHVPYKQGTQVMVDLAGGHLDVAIEMTSAAIAHMKTGAVRALAIVGDRPKQVAPDVPTAAQAGMPGLDLSVWVGFVVPRATPPEIVARLNRDLGAAIRDPHVADWLDRLGSHARTSTPAEFASTIRSDCTRWSHLAQTARTR